MVENKKLNEYKEKNKELYNVIIQKNVDKYLKLVSILESLDADRLNKLAINQLGMEGFTKEKQDIFNEEKLNLIKNIIEKKEYKDILIKGNLRPSNLLAILLIFIPILFSVIFLFLPDILTWWAAILSVLAFFIGLFAYYHSNKIFKETLAVEKGKEPVKFILSLVMGILFGLTIALSADWKLSFTNLGNIATVAGFSCALVFYLYEKVILSDYYRDWLIFAIIIAVELISLFYNCYLPIKGDVKFQASNKPVAGAIIKLNKESLSDFQKKCCEFYDDHSQLKDKNELFDWFSCNKWRYEAIRNTRLCETETNGEGKFFLRVLQFSKENIKVAVKISSFFNKDYEYERIENIFIDENEFLTKGGIGGIWECNLGLNTKIYLKIPPSNSEIDYLNIEPFEGTITSIIEVNDKFEEIQVSSEREKLKKFYHFGNYCFDGKDSFFYDYKTKIFKNTNNYIRGVLKENDLGMEIGKKSRKVCCKKFK